MQISKSQLSELQNARHYHPHDILGMHPVKSGLVVRALLQDARTCEVVDTATDERFPMQRLTEEGFFEGVIKNRKEVFPYRLRVERYNGEIRQFYDPYRFLPTVNDEDLYLFNKGDDHRVYRKLGSHQREIDGVGGVSFAVWAPSARRVSVVGDFNHWDGRYHPMRALGSSGVWEIFIPGLSEGMKYKYEILDQEGYLHLKTDPYGTFFEAPPHNASIICHVDDYGWNDADYLRKRAETDWKHTAISAYEVHFGSWKRRMEDGGRPFTYREMARELVPYVVELGYTHVEFMPLAEHPFTGSWGYQVTGYFAPTQRYGEPADFQYLVDQLHQAGIGVIIDWVPAHFPTDSFALAKFDGSALYEHADPRQGYHHDWGTFIPNYGRHEVRAFLIASALAWMDRYHIDGFRVDAVASMLYLDYSREEGEWIPNQYGGNENIEALEFLRTTNQLVHQYYPGTLMIAEESTSFPGISKPVEEGGVGFDFKWNMGWMNDTLQYFQKDPIYRKFHQNNLTFGMIYQYSENFVQCFSHDEVVHGKSSMLMKMAAGSISEKARDLRSLYALMWGWPGKKTLFMGSEFGQSAEWSYDYSLDWHLLQYKDHSGIRDLVRDLNHLYRNEPALAYGDTKVDGFEWVSANDADSSVIAFLRKGRSPRELFLVVGHYTPISRSGYAIGVPMAGYWKEVINTDAECYGGGGGGNFGGLHTDAIAWDNHMNSLKLTLPGNSTLIFKYEGPVSG
ncbi:MAG: 1,4-alpha-glucan branching protein GlgB [Verrucomicrobia bacterium]|jgi:1,4-alpha-glucan branching enzyme|nr:1,4-alpha-glucan branching protein GlgB [Verrucomicrobiota bacterium]